MSTGFEPESNLKADTLPLCHIYCHGFQRQSNNEVPLYRKRRLSPAPKPTSHPSPSPYTAVKTGFHGGKSERKDQLKFLLIKYLLDAFASRQEIKWQHHHKRLKPEVF